MREIEILAELRALVGYLGEEHGWWGSQFFSRSSRTFLTPVFPRSLPLSQYQGVTVAAARAHDEHIGVGRIVHLFRMPELHEQAGAAVLRDAAGVDQIFAHLGSQEQAMERLSVLAAPVEPNEGPVLVGEWEEDLALLLGRMAGHYVAAMQGYLTTYPYLRYAE
jgi:hypothetical protein